MNKKLISAVSLAVVTISFTNVRAEVWFPTGPFALENVGEMSLSKGALFIPCSMSGSGSLNYDSASLTTMVFTGGPLGACGVIEFEGLPYTIKATSATTIEFQNFNAGAFGGAIRCSGNLAASFDQATGLITFTGAALPDVVTPGSDPCIINGTMSTTPQVSYTFP